MNIFLENDEVLVELSTKGGALERIYNKKTKNEHIWKYDPKIWARRTSICFPICGRLLGNEYIIDDSIYSMPMHGFVREMDFEVITQTETKVILQVKSDADTLRVYPYIFRLAVSVELIDTNVAILYEIKNNDNKPMYYSIGSHYAYKVPISDNEKLDDYCIDFQTVQNAGRLLYTEGFVSGKAEDYFKGKSILDLEGLFEKGSIAFELKDITTPSIILRSKKSPTRTTVAIQNYTHLLLWAPGPTAPFICIEAWAGIPDTIGHNKILAGKKGILNLAEGGVCRHVQQIKIE